MSADNKPGRVHFNVPGAVVGVLIGVLVYLLIAPQLFRGDGVDAGHGEGDAPSSTSASAKPALLMPSSSARPATSSLPAVSGPSSMASVSSTARVGPPHSSPVPLVDPYDDTPPAATARVRDYGF